MDLYLIVFLQENNLFCINVQNYWYITLTSFLLLFLSWVYINKQYIMAQIADAYHNSGTITTSLSIPQGTDLTDAIDRTLTPWPQGKIAYDASSTLCYSTGTDWIATADADDYVVAAGTSTDNAVPRYDGTTGELIQNSGVIIDDSNNVTGIVNINGKPADSLIVASGTSTDNAIARFDGTTGELIQNSGVIIDDTNNITGVVNINTKPADSLVVAAGTSTDNAITRYDGTTGELIQNSTVIVDDLGNLTGVGTVNGSDLAYVQTGFLAIIWDPTHVVWASPVPGPQPGFITYEKIGNMLFILFPRVLAPMNGPGGNIISDQPLPIGFRPIQTVTNSWTIYDGGQGSIWGELYGGTVNVLPYGVVKLRTDGFIEFVRFVDSAGVEYPHVGPNNAGFVGGLCTFKLL